MYFSKLCKGFLCILRVSNKGWGFPCKQCVLVFLILCSKRSYSVCVVLAKTKSGT